MHFQISNQPIYSPHMSSLCKLVFRVFCQQCFICSKLLQESCDEAVLGFERLQEFTKIAAAEKSKIF